MVKNPFGIVQINLCQHSVIYNIKQSGVSLEGNPRLFGVIVVSSNSCHFRNNEGPKPGGAI